MGRNEKKYGTIGLMILTVIIIFSVVGIVIAGFRMIKKNEDARLISAADTEYNKDKEKRQEIEDHLESDGTQEANTETETKGESEEAASDSETDSRKKSLVLMRMKTLHLMKKQMVRQKTGFTLFQGMIRAQTDMRRHSICLIRQRLSILYRIFLYLIPMD